MKFRNNLFYTLVLIFAIFLALIVFIYHNRKLDLEFEQEL